MMDSAQISAHIGRRIHWRQREWLLRDYLRDSGLLVLESTQSQVQANAYGEGHRKVPERLEIESRSEEGQRLLAQLQSGG